VVVAVNTVKREKKRRMKASNTPRCTMRRERKHMTRRVDIQAVVPDTAAAIRAAVDTRAPRAVGIPAGVIREGFNVLICLFRNRYLSRSSRKENLPCRPVARRPLSISFMRQRWPVRTANC
jgi:hypothetical protein